MRYNLLDQDGAVTGNFEMAVPDALEGSGQVTGNHSGSRVTLSARFVVVPVGTDAEINTSADFTGTLLGDRIAGEISFEGFDAPAGTDETGRPIGVRFPAFAAPITLVRR